MSSAQPPNPQPPARPEASTRPAKPIKRAKRPDPADYPVLPPMLQLTGNTPIPPASEPLQYRAIGLILGKYLPSVEEFNQGTLLADDGTVIDAVILGRILSLIKNHLDLEKSHLWVVYPRIRKEDNKLHAQIMGIWDPHLTIEPLNKVPIDREPNAQNPDLATIPSLETIMIPDNYFSIRGEVIYQSRETREIFVKIRQAPKKKDEEERYFKIRLVGDLPQKMVGNFWDFDVLRVADDLTIRSGQSVASLRAKLPRKGGSRPPGDVGSKKPFKHSSEESEGTNPTERVEGEKVKPTMPVKRQVAAKLDLPDVDS
jgi:hypothetical protein